MREAYLLNSSQTITSIPLYEKLPATINGREVLRLQYKKLVPQEEFSIGIDISSDKRKYYSQFRSILIELKFREVVEEIKEPEEDEEQGSEEGLMDEEESLIETPSEVSYTEADLLKKRQAELIELANSLGIEATTQESKLQIAKKILEKISVG